jgi:hypothetical protein
VEVYRNRRSRQYFIYLFKIPNGDEALFINPKLQVIRLPLSRFEDPIDEEEGSLVLRGIITEGQVEKHQRYERNKKMASLDKYLLELEHWSHDKQVGLIEALEKLVGTPQTP